MFKFSENTKTVQPSTNQRVLFKILWLISLSMALFLSSCTKISSFNLEIPDFNTSPLTEKSISDSRFYIFTAEQKIAFSNFFEKYGDAAVLVNFSSSKIKKTADGSGSRLELGFFYEDEEAALKNLSSRPVVTDSFAKYEGAFSLAFCVEREKQLPAGFFVRTGGSYTIGSVQIVRAFAGHILNGPYPVYGFAPNGGFNDGKDDFSGASLAFSSVNGTNSVMPYFKIQFGEDDGSQKIAFGGETLTFRRTSSAVEVPAAALKTPFSAVTYPDGEAAPSVVIMLGSDASLLSFSSSSRNPVEPIKVDPGLIMKWSINTWRGNDFELFEWDRFEGVLIMDISTYAVQDDFFRRLAYFVEKAGYRGKLLSDEFLRDKHGYNAHDYRAESLAEFFEKVRVTGFEINDREKLLKEILLRNGVIVEALDGTISAGRGAVISISQESPLYLRTTFIAHEGWHGIFFVDDDFKNTVASVYYTLDANTLKYLRKYFQVTPTLNYDVNDDYLMKNEFMAYMLQRPVSAVSKYFVDMASREHSQSLAKSEADYVIETQAEGFVSAASLLDEYVSDRWNLNAGRVWLITR